MKLELTLELCPKSKALREGPEKKEAFPEGAGDIEVGKSLLMVTPICVHCWAAVDGA